MKLKQAIKDQPRVQTKKKIKNKAKKTMMMPMMTRMTPIDQQNIVYKEQFFNKVST